MPTVKRNRPRKVDVDVIQAIEQLSLEGHGPAAIRRHLDGQPEFRGRAPADARTVQRIVKDFQPEDGSAGWQLRDADGADAGRVLPVLAAVVEVTEGRRRSITTREATWVVRISQAAPGLAPWDIYQFARCYMLREDHGEPTTGLDTYLAFTPWRGADHWERYAKLFAFGVPIPSEVLFMAHMRGAHQKELFAALHNNLPSGPIIFSGDNWRPARAIASFEEVFGPRQGTEEQQP